MADVFDKQKRSAIMSAVKSKNTKAELMVFRYLRYHKVYFQRHYRRVPGSPDLALPRKKKTVFIDGDFWHGRTYDNLLAKHGADSFWPTKVGRNVKRDKEQRAKLLDGGWQICQVWVSDLSRLSTRQEALEKIRAFLTS
jgi:DNA mismatch endonuclease (patch repair protein)